MAREVQYTQHGREVTKSGICEVSGKLYQSTITVNQYMAWQSGTLAQRAMPDLNNDEREFWVSSTTPDEWNKIFPPEEDEDE